MCHWLDGATCARLCAEAEAHAARHGGWGSRRHAQYATVDVELSHVAALRAWVAPRLHATLLPSLAALFEIEDVRRLRVRELFMVKYEAATTTDVAAGTETAAAGAEQQPGLELHRDGYLLSFNVLCSEPGAAFAGGGTRLETLGIDLRPDAVGDVLLHCGQMLHGGAPVTRGVRYILVGFVEVEAPFSQELHDYRPPDCAGQVDRDTLALHWAAINGLAGKGGEVGQLPEASDISELGT